MGDLREEDKADYSNLQVINEVEIFNCKIKIFRVNDGLPKLF